MTKSRWTIGSTWAEPILDLRRTGIFPILCRAIPQMDVTDTQLMQRIAAGDEAAFRQFHDRHLTTVMQVLYRLLREHADVEDVAQETFLRIWHRSYQYDPNRASPAGYLTLIARSRALDLIRKRRPDLPPDKIEPSFEYDMSLQLTRDESVGQVRQAMMNLPAEQRQVIRMAFMAGLTHEQIALALKLPLGTVKTRIRLGLRRLKSMIPDDGNGA